MEIFDHWGDRSDSPIGSVVVELLGTTLGLGHKGGENITESIDIYP